MAITATTSFDNPDPDACPTTFQETIDILNDLVETSVAGTFSGIIQGSSVPAVDDQDEIWCKFDAQGRPIGWFKYYNGNWRPVYTHPLGAIVMFTGDPSGLFDGTGLGIVNTVWDGFAICNGNNTTTNLSDKFVVGARMDGVGISQYDSGWQTNVGGSAAKTGGSSTITLNDGNTYQPPVTGLTVGYWGADGNAPGTSAGGLYGRHHPEVADNDAMLLAGDPGNTTPLPITTLPPYFACAYVQFIGYS